MQQRAHVSEKDFIVFLCRLETAILAASCTIRSKHICMVKPKQNIFNSSGLLKASTQRMQEVYLIEGHFLCCKLTTPEIPCIDMP